jgi:hypothetical protein
MGYACDACIFGTRVSSWVQSIATVKYAYPRLNHRDLNTLWMQVRHDTPTLLHAAQSVQEANGRDRIIAAVEGMMQAERVGSWDL